MPRVPIIAIQRRLHETGRIRIGQQVEATGKGGKKITRPSKLDTFRLTSTSREAIEAVASLYGGEPVPWEDGPTSGQWELFTESYSLQVVVPPEEMSFTQHYELWSGGGCQRRCDGIKQIPGGEDCVCDDDVEEDPENPKCKLHTRLSVMLTDVPGTGLWRLDTQGWNAAVELGGAFQVAGMISRASGRALIPGTLRLDQREVKRPGEVTKKFAVPVLDFAVDLAALETTARAALPAAEAASGLASGVTPVRSGDESSLADELRGVEEPPPRSTRANAAEPVRPTGLAPRGRGAAPEPDEEVSGGPVEEAEVVVMTPPEALITPWSVAIRTGADAVPEKSRKTFGQSWADAKLWKPEQLRGVEELERAKRVVEICGGKVEFPPFEPIEGVHVPGCSLPADHEGACEFGDFDEHAAESPEGEGDDGVSDAEIVEDGAPGLPESATVPEVPMITEGRAKTLQIKFRALGIGEREQRLVYCRAVCRREDISSTKDLTLAEGVKVLDQLNADLEEAERERVGAESGGEPF